MSVASMTPAEAREVYPISEPERWHSQPWCACGDYLGQHQDEPPHRCHVCSGKAPNVCRGFAFAGPKS